MSEKALREALEGLFRCEIYCGCIDGRSKDKHRPDCPITVARAALQSQPEQAAKAGTFDVELRDFEAEWVELPQVGSGHWFLHILQCHGNDTVTEMWLTKKQAGSLFGKLYVADFGEAIDAAKRANDTQLYPSKEVDDLLRHLEQR